MTIGEPELTGIITAKLMTPYVQLNMLWTNVCDLKQVFRPLASSCRARGRCLGM